MELFNPESGLIIWMLIVFLSAFAILGKFAWPAITQAIAKREKYIADAIKVADKANDRFERIKEERAGIIAAAREEQNNILKEVQALKEKLIAEAKAQAQSDAKKIIADARLTIQAEKELALKEVKNQVALISVGIASKILRKNLESDAAQMEHVNSILDGIKTLN